MLWLSLLSFFLINTIAGSFTGLKVTPESEKNVDTLEEVADRIQTIYATQFQMMNIKALEQQGSVLARLAGKVGVAHLTRMKHIIPPKFAMTGNERLLSMGPQQEGAFVNGVLQYHKVKECLIETSYLSFVVKKSWPGADAYNSLMQRLVESGLISHFKKQQWDWWLRSLCRYHKIRMKPVHQQSNMAAPIEALTLLHVREAMMLWIVGLGFAAMSFFTERFGKLLTSRVKKKCFFSDWSHLIDVHKQKTATVREN